MSSPQTSPAPGSPPASSRRAIPVVVIGVLVVLMLAFGRVNRRDPGLTEKRARYLQDVEHLGGFVLGDLCLPKLAGAIATDDDDELSAAFAKIAGAWIPPEIDQMASRQHGAVTVTTWQRIEQKREDVVDGEQLVSWLQEQRRRFASIDAVRLKVKRMQPETAGRLDGPWNGTLQLNITGQAAEERPRSTTFELSCRLGSLDDQLPERDDWFLELVVDRAEITESSRLLMEEMTDETGIDVARLHDNWRDISGSRTPALTGGIYLADYDGDRHVDCLVTDISGPGPLPRNRQGTIPGRDRPGGIAEVVQRVAGRLGRLRQRRRPRPGARPTLLPQRSGRSGGKNPADCSTSWPASTPGSS
ncbi:MAG: hypothetical protein Ct9H300mP1_33580 [Planctomycetaceae bacterium]|nr:MAG: hypothetical protein Ct9H300mP1_33580 [Planctomycetaceae bacterium]